MRRTKTWPNYNQEQVEQLEKINDGYKAFLDAGKTERECVTETVRLAREAGYISLEEAAAQEGGEAEVLEKLLHAKAMDCFRQSVTVVDRPVEQWPAE